MADSKPVNNSYQLVARGPNLAPRAVWFGPRLNFKNIKMEFLFYFIQEKEVLLNPRLDNLLK